MTTLIIGSTAAKHHLPDWREPKDVDVFSDIPTTLSWAPARVDVFWHDSLSPWLPPHSGQRYATLNELLTIKTSHAAWDLRNGSWFKHMADTQALLLAGARVDEDLYAMLYSVWEERYGKKRVDLNYDKAAFFDDAVKRRYDHDSVHRSCAFFPGEPQYEKYLNGEVNMDMKKVWAAGDRAARLLFMEEIAATALERYVIPSDYTCSPRWAWSQALKKTVTSLTKGKSSRFIVDNYDWFRTPPYDYVKQHNDNRSYLEDI